MLYTLADNSLEVNGKQIAVEAAHSCTLPMLRTDTPELAELLVDENSKEAGAFAVTTRAREKEKEMENRKRMQEEARGVQPN